MNLLHRAVHVIEFVLVVGFAVVGVSILLALLLYGLGFLLGVASLWVTEGWVITT